MTGRDSSSPNQGRVTGSGLELAFREWNPGAPGIPLVLLHGITGSGADWQAVAARMVNRRLIALDARGHGTSDWAPDEAYGGDQHFADVAAAIEALGIERCVVAGFSMGGGVAIMVAAALPVRIAGAVVIDAYPHPKMTIGSRRIASWISTYGESAGNFDPAISRHFQDQLAAGREDRLDLWSMWEAIECPVMVVRGELSDVLTAENAAEMAARQPRAQLVAIVGVAHQIPVRRPSELAERIELFVRKLE